MKFVLNISLLRHIASKCKVFHIVKTVKLVRTKPGAYLPISQISTGLQAFFK